MLDLPPHLLAALDAWIASQPEPKPTRSQAVEMAVADWLVCVGAVPLEAAESIVCSPEAG